MEDSTVCSVEECTEKPSRQRKIAKGMCCGHYAEHKKDNAPRCSLDGCDKPVHTLGFCSTHAARFKVHGRADDGCLQRTPNSGLCSVEGCENPMRKRAWCASHYSQWKMTGSVKPFSYKWAERGKCVVCGEPCNERGRRTYCSAKCQQLVSRHGGLPPETKPCSRCGKDIDLFDLGRSGRKKRLDAVMCKPCKHARMHTRHHMSIERLVERDGVGCSICGEEVDVTLKKPDRLSPSVDHVLPYSLGGTHDPENLALAHLWCNQVKNNRVGWSLKTA